MKIEVGSYEAKTRLPELLRGVQAGFRYTLTLRGKAMAELVPVDASRHADAGAAVDEMLHFMQNRSTGDGFELKQLIEEGRL